MFDDRRTQRAFFSAPQTVRSLVAAVLEPAASVAVYLSAAAWFDRPLARADLTLCLVTVALLLPGRDRFADRALHTGLAIAGHWLMVVLLLAVGVQVTRSLNLFDQRVLMAWALLTPVLQWAGVALGRAVLHQRARSLSEARTVVIIGAGAPAMKVVRALRASADRRVELLGCFDDRSDDRVHPDAAPMRLGNLRQVAAFVREQRVDEVYITLALGSQPRIVDLLEQLHGSMAAVFFVPDLFGNGIVQGRLHSIRGVPVVGIGASPFNGSAGLIKRFSDIVVALLVLLLTSPLLVLAALGIKLGSKGPLVVAERRIGPAGDEVVLYRFRTADTVDCETPAVPRSEPRVTRFGAFLRHSSLDRLPQFVNVLQGRLSIVGPQAHAAADHAHYQKLIKGHLVHANLRPGVTGWAQVNGQRGEADTLEKMRLHVEYDLEYLRNWSLGLDLQIIARTLERVLFGRPAA